MESRLCEVPVVGRIGGLPLQGVISLIVVPAAVHSIIYVVVRKTPRGENQLSTLHGSFAGQSVFIDFGSRPLRTGRRLES